MSFQFVDLEDARSAGGTRMTVVSGIPSPWSEAAKGILGIKRIPLKGVRYTPGNAELNNWTGCHNAPVLKHNDEAALTGWADILVFAERIAPEPSLIPADPEQRALMFGLAHELMGTDGLCWLRRLQIVHGGKQMQGRPRQHADYIGSKYGYAADDVARGHQRIIALLNLFAGILNKQTAQQQDYYLGPEPSALDIYSAAAMALFSPLPEADCPMDQGTRMAFSMMDKVTAKNLDPVLLAHRDRMYREHLALPLSL